MRKDIRICFLVSILAINIGLSGWTIHADDTNEVNSINDITEIDNTTTITLDLYYVEDTSNGSRGHYENYTSCGNLVLSASNSLVSFVIYLNRGWIFWDAQGYIYDTLGDDYRFYLYSTGSSSKSDSYLLTTRGNRTLSLEVSIRDLGGSGSCYVEPYKAFINHTW